MSDIAGLLPLLLIAVLFWLLIIRPASRRQKEQARMQSALAVGDEVMLTSGIFGEVTGVVDDRLLVEVAPGVTLTVARGAIGSVVRNEEREAEQADSERSEGDAGSEDL